MINIIRSQLPQGEIDFQNPIIREIIKNDFFRMCYLCEEVTRHYEIDHFYPQKFYPNDVNNWDNLFYICQKCNKIKPKNINTHSHNEILNSCFDDVESLIVLRYKSTEDIVEISTDNQDDRITLKIKETIKLLRRVYNGEKDTQVDLRQGIKNELAEFVKILDKYEKAIERFKFIYETQIKQRLSKRNLNEKSSFVSFKRRVILDNPQWLHFKIYFD
jgi:uncharacterized protein (TIGR02646 family)